MPPWREHGGRAGVVTSKVGALQRQVHALQEFIGDGSEEDILYRKGKEMEKS